MDTVAVKERIPTLRSYERVDYACTQAQEELESVALKLRRILEGHENGTLELARNPDLADLGALCSFVYGLELTIGCIIGELRFLKEALGRFDEMRLDLEVSREREV